MVGSADVRPESGRLLAFSRDDGSVARMAVVRPASAPPSSKATPVGRYVVGPKIATGGMATVHLGRLRGSAGFARTVAIKKLLPTLASDPEFVARFVEEARIASRVRHANVVPTLDVVDGPEVLLVLEYVHGESLARLLRIAASRGQRCPPNVAAAIVIGVLRGLHVAHEAKGANGVPLELVHRDVSPQNVLVGSDGAPRMLDFGIAKAAGHEQSTITKGSSQDLRGKLAYMAPEQLSGEPLDRRADLFAAGVMLWETLSGDRLFRGEDAFSTMEAIFHRDPPALAAMIDGVSPRVDEVLATALAKDAAMRFATANEMARALETALPPGSDREVAEWVDAVAGEVLAARATVITAFEGSTDLDDERERDVQDPTTQKRSALAPLPRMRDEAKTIPGFDPADPNRDPDPIRTPMAMVAPVADPLAASGMSAARFGPVDWESANRAKPAPASTPPFRTPIPMPMPAAKPRASLARVVALILLPPAVAALSIFVIRPAASPPLASAHATNAAAPIAVSAEIPPPPASPPVSPPAPAVTAKVADPPAHAPAATSASAAPASRGARSPRGPSVRPPRKR